MNYDEFLESTPRIVTTMDIFNKNYEENIMIGVVAKLYKSKNDIITTKKDNRKIVDSFDELF